MRIHSRVRNFVYVLFALLMVLPAVSLAQPARVEAATQAEIDAAIASGCAWLVTQQQGNGSWTGGFAADTGFAVAALEHYAEQLGKTPLDPTYIYRTNVQNGLNYLFSTATRDSVGHDWVWWNVGGNDAYQTGPCLMAIARSGAPTAVVVGGALNGMTYKQVAQAAVDWLYTAQVPSGINIGAWYYTKGSPTTNGDQSATGWATMGLGYAVHSMGCTIPADLLTKLSLWNEYIQTHTVGADFGGAGYTAPGYWVNVYKTGHLLFAHKLCGSTLTTPRVQEALTYLNTHWGDLDGDPGWRGNPPGTPPSYIATLALTKGFTEMGIETFSGHNWYNDFVDVIVTNQYPDGHWYGSGLGETNNRSTCWALMTLLKVHSAPAPTVTAVNPASGAMGECLTVIITGTGFTGATAVNFGTGITVNGFTVDNDTQITANICIAADAATGARDVSVTTPSGTGTGTALFTVNAAAAAPAPVPVPKSPRASPAPTSSWPFNPALLSIQYLSVNPQQTSAGQPVTITANVVNTGDQAGNYYLALKINGQAEQTRMVSVGPQGTQPMKFTVTKAQPGTYTVDIGEQRGSFVVLGASSSSSAPVNGGLIVILIMGVLILATIVVLLVSRRTA